MTKKLTLKDIALTSVYVEAVEQAKVKAEQTKAEQRAAMAKAMREFGALKLEERAALIAKRNPGSIIPVHGDRVSAPVGDNINDPAKLRVKRRVQAKPTWEEEAKKRQDQYDEQQRQDYLRWLNKKARDEQRLDMEFWASVAEARNCLDFLAAQPETSALVHTYQWGGVQGGASSLVMSDITTTKLPGEYNGLKLDVKGDDDVTSALINLMD